MKLNSALTIVKDEFNAILIPNLESVKQSGLYLCFLGLKNEAPIKDVASFALVFVSASLDGNVLKPITQLEKIRKQIFELGSKFGSGWFKGLKAARYEESGLYAYVFMLEIKISLY